MFWFSTKRNFLSFSLNTLCMWFTVGTALCAGLTTDGTTLSCRQVGHSWSSSLQNLHFVSICPQWCRWCWWLQQGHWYCTAVLKMHFLPHISSPSSQVWKIPRQKGAIFSRWVPTALSYLEKCSVCSMCPLQVIGHENSWQELHFSRLLDPPVPGPQTLDPPSQYLDPRPPSSWTLDPTPLPRPPIRQTTHE